MLKLCDRADESQLFSYTGMIQVLILILQQIFSCQTDLINALEQYIMQTQDRFHHLSELECNCQWSRNLQFHSDFTGICVFAAE